MIPTVSGDSEAMECDFPSCTGWPEGNCDRTEMCGSLNTPCNLPAQALCSQARKLPGFIPGAMKCEGRTQARYECA